jgi:VWFA-related protein
MTVSLCRVAAGLNGLARLPVYVLLLASALALPARADVNVRVEARPPSAPIEVFINVTDANGDPLGGLAASDFTITIDGDPITIADGDLTLPPAQDPNQRVSVVFTMDYSPSVVAAARAEMEQAVVDFVNGMNDGDYAAIVKFNATNPNGASLVAEFTEIDHGANNAALEAAARSDYPGNGTNLLDALELSINHILTPPLPLPTGPKSIVLISDGGEFDSTVTQSEVLALANDNSIPIFTIGVADLSEPGFQELLESLAGGTGGEFFEAPTAQNIADAYDTILLRLQNEYVLSIPNGITDCAEHEMVVEVTGQAPVSVLFTRRICDTEPNPFSFNALTGLDRGETVTSNTVTITGIEVPAHISVIAGSYSIGCGPNDSDFTSQPGTISDGETVCVRTTASNQASTTKVTTLTIGGIAGTFSTTTAAGSGGGGGGGGGGATGLFELLLALAALAVGRRRVASQPGA